MYTDKVMDHFVNPRNVGEIDDASGVGQVGNAKCGDIMKIFIKVDENDVITDVKFKTFGCGAAIASSSMATELVKGKTVDEALQITNKMAVSYTHLSEMDPIAVGGAYNLYVSALEGFDYVALGHIHRPQAIGRPTVRYAGSPLKYSFSEARHEKSVTLVEIKEKGQVELTALPLAPKRDMLVVEGPLEALLSAGEPSDCFVRAILTDEGPVLDAAARLKTIYPNLLRIDFPIRPLQAEGGLAAEAGAVERLSPEELLEDFFAAVHGRPMSQEQREMARKALEGGKLDAAQ